MGLAFTLHTERILLYEETYYVLINPKWQNKSSGVYNLWRCIAFRISVQFLILPFDVVIRVILKIRAQKIHAIVRILTQVFKFLCDPAPGFFCLYF